MMIYHLVWRRSNFQIFFFTPFVLVFLTLGVVCLLDSVVHCHIVCFSCGMCEMACASRLSQAMNQILMQLLWVYSHYIAYNLIETLQEDVNVKKFVLHWCNHPCWLGIKNMLLESYFCYIYKNAELQTRKKVMCLDFMNNRRTVSPVLCCCTVIASANNLLIYFSPYWKKLIKKRGGGIHSSVSGRNYIYFWHCFPSSGFSASVQYADNIMTDSWNN